MQPEQQTHQAVTAPEIAPQPQSVESRPSKRGGSRPGAGRKPNLAKRLLKGFSRGAIAEPMADVDVGMVITSLLRSKRERTKLETLIFVRDTLIGRPAQNVQVSGGVLHAHTDWRPLASLNDEEVALLDAITKKLAAPVPNTSPDAPQNQIESNRAIEAEVVAPRQRAAKIASQNGDASRFKLPAWRMVEIGPAREADVVLAFLKAEVDYSDHRQGIQQNLATLGYTRLELIDEADLSNDYENALRAVLLDSYRGYLRRTFLFSGFPKKVTWRRVELEPADFARLTYIANEPSWDSYSQRTRSPQVVADRMARRELPDSFAQTIAAIQDKLKRNETLPELVAVEGEGDKLILIEGAHRITAYVGLNWQTNIPAIVGRSDLMPNWHWYAYRP